MRSRCKILVGDISRGVNLDSSIKEYAELLNGQYNYYALVRMCMNYYTMKEIATEQEDGNTDVCRYFSLVTELVKEHIIERHTVTVQSIEKIRHIRDNIEYKMRNLTAYTDGYEIYEYILNRIEAGIKGTIEDIDREQLSARMFKYVFMENDTVVINSKLQLLMSQLPVRMTKNKFYDIVANTLSIYKGGEASSVDEFADMLRSAVLIKRPKGFETEYPYLYHVFTDLEKADYNNMDSEGYDSLNGRLSQAAKIINNEVSAFMLLQEVVNDVYTILLTIDRCYESNIGNMGYKAALNILEACLMYDNLDEMPESVMSEFMSIEGVQETVYESVMLLEAIFDDVRTGHSDIIENMALSDTFESLDTVSRLLSTSLFVDLDKKADNDALIADNNYIMKLREELTADFAKLFSDKSRMVNRSIMCKILSSMPVFMNSQQEIKDYFDYVLESCKDESELTACSRLINSLMEDDM